MKILGKVLLAIVLLLIGLPLLISLLLDIPAVQNFALRKATSAISRKLETTVSIDRIDIGIFTKVKIKGLYVEDYQRDTLLYVGKLDAYVSSFGIFGGGVVLSRGEIDDARLYLHETPDSVMNIKQIIDRISNPDREKKKGGGFKLTLKKAAIKNMTFCLEKLKHREPEYGIDFGHMHLSEMTAFVDDLTIDGAAIYTTINTLSARERSGFELDHFSGRFYLNNGCIGFEDAIIATKKSYVHLPYISLLGDSWADYKYFVGKVSISGAMRNTSISTDDVAYFSPKLRQWHTLFSNINCEIAGEVDDFTGTISSMQIGQGTHLAATASIKGLPDIKNTHFDLAIPSLTSSAGEINLLAGRIVKKELSEKLVEIIGNSGKIDLNASFKGMMSSFDMKSSVNTTAAGSLTCNVHLKPQKGGMSSVRGSVATRNIRLGRLLGREDLLGSATIEAEIDGVVGPGYADANVVGQVGRLEFNNYTYDSLRLDGRLQNRCFDGAIRARDPNLNFDFSGKVDFTDSIPAYDFTMDLHHADLAKLQINRRDSISRITARIEAAVSGRSLDDLNGRIRITDAVYNYNDKTIASSYFTVRGENSERSKLVELRSDFADATFKSQTSYREVFEYLKQSVWKYLPMLSSEPQTSAQRGELKASVANDFSVLLIDIRNINPIADAITEGLQIADGSKMDLMFNPASDQLSLKANSNYIERANLLVTRLSINASNRGDSLTFFASAEDLYTGGLHMPRFSVSGGAKQNRIQASAGFTDSTRLISARVGMRAEVVDEHGPNGRLVEVRMLPSHLSRGETTWQIYARRIQLDTARVVVDRFRISNYEQQLQINGVASRSRSDSLTLTLQNFDLGPFSQIVDRMGYVIEGRSNGSATMLAALHESRITADITLDSVKVNTIPAPPLRLTSRWDFQNNRASVTITNRIKLDTLIRGYYNPSEVRYFARAHIDSLDLGLLDPILTGVISGTKGLASADLTVRGERREADLTGEIRISDFRTTVDYTQVTYRIPSAVMTVRNNKFKASNLTVADQQGNRGRLDIDLSLQHLSNISYDVRVAPRQMMVMNTTSADNDFFYGRVYATGSARIVGDKGNTRMDISAATNDNSTFFMPLSSKSNISYADFVTFKKPELVDSTDVVALRKLQFERRRQKKAATSNQMRINLALDVKDNVDVELMVAGSAVKAHGKGMLNIQINPRTNLFEMTGDYAITEGSYLFNMQNIISKKFIIQNGSTIQWTGSPMDAMLNINAVYKVKASLKPLLQSSGSGNSAERSVPVDCVIHLGDRLSRPNVKLDVRVSGTDPEMQTLIANALTTPEQIDTQFAYLLLFNSFMSEGSASDIASSVSAATGLEFVSNLASNWLSGDDYGVILRYRPKTDQSSDELDFGLSKSLVNDRLLVEVEGNYIIDNRQAVSSQMSNFMGEAHITYLIDRSGALKVRAFTQTIDRFDENQGLQETGVGITFKEDFDNFKDLRQRIKDRFTNKKRKTRREARAAEKAAADSTAKAAAKATDSTAKAAKEEKERQTRAADTLSAGAAVINEQEKNNANK